MVDPRLHAVKIAAIMDAVERIREILPADPEVFRADRTAREVVTINLFVAVQECLALATHFLADAGWAVPGTYGEVFLSLAAHDVLEEALARRLSAAAGLRNLIAHQYGEIDAVRLHEIALKGPADLVQFCGALARAQPSEGR